MNAMRKRSAEDARRDAIRAFVALEPEIVKLVGQANFNLYWGPSGNDSDFPGFTTACREIASALNDVGDLYLDSQCGEVIDSEPDTCEGCDDEECFKSSASDWIHYDRSSVITILVGRELAPYVR